MGKRGKKAKTVKKRDKKKKRKINKYKLFRLLYLPRKELEKAIPKIDDRDVVDFLAHIRSRAGLPRDAEFPLPLIEFIRHVGGTGLGMSRRFSEGDMVMLPSGHRIRNGDMDSNEVWMHLPYTNTVFPEKFYISVGGAKTKSKGTPLFKELSDFWRRNLRKNASQRAVESEKVISRLLKRFRQGKTQEDFARLALKIGQAHAAYRGWKKIRVGTEVPIYVKDDELGNREIGSRDFFFYGKRVDDGEEYEGISVEVESSFGTPSLKKMMYGLIKSVKVIDPGSKQEASINLVHNIILTPENRMQRKVRELLRLNEWDKVRHEVDGLFDPEKLLDRMESRKAYLVEVLEHLQKSDIHKRVLTQEDIKIIRDTLEDVRKGKNFPQNRWDEIRVIINKVHRANLDRLTIDFNVSDEIVNYLLGKKVVIGGKEIKPKYTHFLQYNTLLYFFSRGFKDSIKERVLRDMLLKKGNITKLERATLAKRVDESVTLDLSPVTMKEILDNMAKHMRKALQNTVFYLTDSKGKEIKKIVIFKKLPEMYRLQPIIITPENKEWLSYLNSLEVYQRELDKKIASGEPITDIRDGRPIGRKVKPK